MFDLFFPEFRGEMFQFDRAYIIFLKWVNQTPIGLID